jgi:hypothetical protein
VSWSNFSSLLAIAEIKTGVIPWYHQPIAAVAAARGSEITIVAAESLEGTRSTKPTTYSVPPADFLSAALPGKSLQELPNNLTHAWNNLVSKELGFRFTEPGLVPLVTSQDSILITTGPSEVTLAGWGKAEELIHGLLKAIQAEESYHRPVRQAFRLPDGTIGFEMVAGEENEIPRPAVGECTSALDLTVCRSETAASISTSREKAQVALNSPVWHVQIGERYLKQTTLSLSALTATRSGEAIVIRARLAPE